MAEVIVKLVQNPHFAALMQQKINMKVDTASLDQEIAFYEKQVRQHTAGKLRLIEEIDALDMEDRHYAARKNDLENRLDKMYDKLEEAEHQLKDARARKQSIEAEKITGDNIYRILTHFEKLYALMTDTERRELMNSLISEIQVYPEPQENGQWLKSIRFRLPIIEGDVLCLDNKNAAECVATFIRPSTEVQV